MVNDYFAIKKSTDINTLISCNLSFCKYFSGFSELDVGNFCSARSFKMHASILRHNHVALSNFDLVLIIVSLLNFYESHVAYLSAVTLDYIFHYFQYFNIVDLFCKLYFADIYNIFNFASDIVQLKAIDSYVISGYSLPLSAQSLNETPQSLCDVDRTKTKCNYDQLQADCVKYLWTCYPIKINSIDISHYDELESTCVDCHEYGFNCNKFASKLKFACFANNDFVSDVTAQGVYNDDYLNFCHTLGGSLLQRQDTYVYIYSHDGSIFR
jgi:hypothetical protein